MVNPELEDFVCSQGVTKVQLQIWAQHGKMQKMQGRERLSATQMFRYEACVIALFLSGELETTYLYHLCVE